MALTGLNPLLGGVNPLLGGIFGPRIGANLQCLFGFVNLFTFIQAPVPGSVIGTLTTLGGQQINLVQSRPGFFGGVPLGFANNQFAVLCGFLRTTLPPTLDVFFVQPLFPFGLGGLGLGGLGELGLGGLGLGTGLGAV